MKIISQKFFDQKVERQKRHQYPSFASRKSDANMFAQLLHEFGVKEMTPSINWIGGREGDADHLKPHPRSFEFRPYVGVGDDLRNTPVPWALAKYFDIGYMGGASKEGECMQMCITSSSNQRWYKETRSARELDQMATEFIYEVYAMFNLLNDERVMELRRKFQQKYE